VSFGTMSEGPRLDADLMFEDLFKEMPEHLRKQRELMRAERDAVAAGAAPGAESRGAQTPASQGPRLSPGPRS